MFLLVSQSARQNKLTKYWSGGSDEHIIYCKDERGKFRHNISQLVRFARVCSHVDDFNTRNKCLTAKLLKQGYRYHKLRKVFF